MSEDNVEVVRRIYDAFARDDLTALLELLDPAIRCYDRPSRPGADVYIGRTGFLRFWQSDREVFESVRYDPREFIEVDDHVVVPIRQTGRGKGSKVPVEEEIVNVWKVRDGRAVELRVYSTKREAFEAVGLRTRD
jgi:ketosteroid isomerase-like protein